MTFKNEAEKKTYLDKYNSEKIFAKRREEWYVKQKESWAIQKTIVSEIINEAERLGREETIAAADFEILEDECFKLTAEV